MARPSPKKDAAKAFITAFLTSAPKKRALADDIKLQALAAGHAKDTFAQASEQLVKDRTIAKRKLGPGGLYHWFLVSALPRPAKKPQRIAGSQATQNTRSLSECRRLGVEHVRNRLHELIADHKRNGKRKPTLTDVTALLERISQENL